MALAKIVGLDVTPRTCRSRISISRLPVDRRSLLMSSSHTDTPAAVSWASASSGREFMTSTPCCQCAFCGVQPGEAGPGRGSSPPSCHYDPRLDADPGPDRVRQCFLLVGSILFSKPFH